MERQKDMIFLTSTFSPGLLGDDKKCFICLFHVSEHVDHFKANFFYLFFKLENDPSEDPPTHPNWKIPI